MPYKTMKIQLKKCTCTRLVIKHSLSRAYQYDLQQGPDSICREVSQEQQAIQVQYVKDCLFTRRMKKSLRKVHAQH